MSKEKWIKLGDYVKGYKTETIEIKIESDYPTIKIDIVIPPEADHSESKERLKDKLKDSFKKNRQAP